MRNKIMAILLIAASIVGCQSENSDETETLTPPPPPPPAVITGPNQPTSPATTAPGSSSGIKLNPPHGQPGHLCEIEVGAPLPASGAAPKTGPISQAIQPSPQPVPQANTSPITINPQPGPISTTPVTATAPGMNPPHGQPNHRCDIAVGAPLSSAPAKPN